MRYRLRTLLIVLALGPPVLAAAWLSVAWICRHPATAFVLWLLVAGFVSASVIAVHAKLLRCAVFAVVSRLTRG